MNLVESLTLERYKFVTDRQKYFTELARDAFASYARFFAGLGAAALALVSSKEKLGIGLDVLLYLVRSIFYLAGFLALAASIQIAFCLWRWRGYRTAEDKINPQSPPPDRWWWVFETLYIAAIWVAFFGAVWVAYKLPPITG